MEDEWMDRNEAEAEAEVGGCVDYASEAACAPAYRSPPLD
jgi:hypothetical protein